MAWDWQAGAAIGLLSGFGLLTLILFASGFALVQVLTIAALVMVPLAVLLGAFWLVWRFVWRLDGSGRVRLKR